MTKISSPLDNFYFYFLTTHRGRSVCIKEKKRAHAIKHISKNLTK